MLHVPMWLKTLCESWSSYQNDFPSDLFSSHLRPWMDPLCSADTTSNCQSIGWTSVLTFRSRFCTCDPMESHRLVSSTGNWAQFLRSSIWTISLRKLNRTLPKAKIWTSAWLSSLTTKIFIQKISIKCFFFTKLMTNSQIFNKNQKSGSDDQNN